MKRKIRNFLLPLALLLSFSSLVSCGEKPFTGKVHLDYGEITDSAIADWQDLNLLVYDDLEKMVNNQESFILTMYDSPSCTCWSLYFAPNLVRYYKETHTRTYIISASEFTSDKSKFGLLTQDIPSIAVFNRGKLVYQSVYYRDDKSTFDQYSKLVEWIDRFTIAPKIYYVTKNVLDDYISTNKTFNLYVSLAGCGDCKALKKSVLNQWIDATTTINEPIYQYEVTANGQEKDDLKDLYGLSNVNNPNLGWNTGYFPTLQRRTGSTISDMITVYNDKWDENSKLVTSYFTEDRLQYMPFLKDDTTIKTKVLDGMELNNYNTDTFRNNYHNPIINLFLNTYVK